MCRLRFGASILCIVSSFAALASYGFAVDQRGIEIGNQWTVVGVISDGHTTGIAVIKDQNTDKTFTVRIGDLLPENTAFRIKEVRRKQVVVSDGTQQVEINYQTPAKDAWGEEQYVSRFAESYFNGFSTVPIEYYQQQQEANRLGGGFDRMPFAMQKASGEQGDASVNEYDRSRNEPAYGGRYTQNGEYQEDSATSDVVINYDSFVQGTGSQVERDGIAHYRRRLRQQQPRWETVPKRVLDEDYSGNEEAVESGEAEENSQPLDEAGYDEGSWQGGEAGDW